MAFKPALLHPGHPLVKRPDRKGSIQIRPCDSCPGCWSAHTVCNPLSPENCWQQLQTCGQGERRKGRTALAATISVAPIMCQALPHWLAYVNFHLHSCLEMQALSVPWHEQGQHWWHLSNTQRFGTINDLSDPLKKEPALHTYPFPTLTSGTSTSVALDYKPLPCFWNHPDHPLRPQEGQRSHNSLTPPSRSPSFFCWS